MRNSTTIMMIMMIVMMVDDWVGAADNNPVYSPCSDTQISKGDGFTIGIAISSKEAFFS
jgi:diphthamide biosynthesis protein 3